MCKNCEWESELQKIDDILDDYNLSDSAIDFLENVREWIADNHHVTDSQADAIAKFE